MSQLVDENQKDLIQKAKKISIGLQSENKRVRMQTFQKLQQFCANESLLSEDYHNIFNEIHISGLNGLRDPSEGVREKSILFWQFLLINKLDSNDYYLSYLFPVLIERIGTCELIEESEEIRLKLMELLMAVIEKYSDSKYLKPFLNDLIAILRERVQDKFPDVKVISCKCITALAAALPNDFHMQAENLIEPVLTCFKHQRNLIRSEAILSIGTIIMHSSYKGVDQVIGALGERLLDNVPSVRRSIGLIASHWLLDHRDRYSYFAKLLPLILTLLNDETEYIQKEMKDKWEEIGLKYMKENESDLKDKMDYLYEIPHYYPKDVIRPNLGCRTLVARNIGKLCKAISNELVAWQDDIREKTSELLYVLLLHAEESVTQHLQGLLPAMYTAVRNEKRAVVIKKLTDAGKIIGIFVPAETWTQLVLPAIEDNTHYGNLTILRSLIEGTSSDQLKDHLDEITNVLGDPDICRTRKLETQKALQDCLVAILSSHQLNYTKTTAQNIFNAFISMYSLRHAEMQIDGSVLTKLQNNMKMNREEDVWCEYLRKLLQIIDRDPSAWVAVTAERCIFETILTKSNSAFGQNLDLIGKILITCLHTDCDAESRLKIFTALSFAFEQKEEFFKESKDLSSFLQQFVSDIVAPSLVWHAGRSAETIRTIAALCLYNALKTSWDINLFKTTDLLASVSSTFIPLLISLLEDASYRSRQLAIQNLALLKELCVENGTWSNEEFLKIYPEITKRLDDPIEKVREWAVKGFMIVLTKPSEEFVKSTYKAHHELLIDTLLTHLDDTDPKYHKEFTEMLLIFVDVCPKLLEEKINVHKTLMRNRADCELILTHLHELKLTDSN